MFSFSNETHDFLKAAAQSFSFQRVIFLFSITMLFMKVDLAKNATTFCFSSCLMKKNSFRSTLENTCYFLSIVATIELDVLGSVVKF